MNLMEGNDENTRSPLSDDLTFDGRQRCTAKSQQSGSRCQRAATPGTTICATHGSKAPQVRRSAALRLIELVDPAIATLAREMVNQRATPGERIRAAENVLDRAGYPRRLVTDSDTARDLLIVRLLEVQARRAEDTEGELVQGELVTEESDDQTETAYEA